jgi:hypothetical protein
VNSREVLLVGTTLVLMAAVDVMIADWIPRSFRRFIGPAGLVLGIAVAYVVGQDIRLPTAEAETWYSFAVLFYACTGCSYLTTLLLREAPACE